MAWIKNNRQNQGFTFIELMAALVIFGVISAYIYKVVISTGRGIAGADQAGSASVAHSFAESVLKQDLMSSAAVASGRCKTWETQCNSVVLTGVTPLVDTDVDGNYREGFYSLRLVVPKQGAKEIQVVKGMGAKSDEISVPFEAITVLKKDDFVLISDGSQSDVVQISDDLQRRQNTGSEGSCDEGMGPCDVPTPRARWDESPPPVIVPTMYYALLHSYDENNQNSHPWNYGDLSKAYGTLATIRPVDIVTIGLRVDEQGDKSLVRRVEGHREQEAVLKRNVQDLALTYFGQITALESGQDKPSHDLWDNIQRINIRISEKENVVSESAGTKKDEALNSKVNDITVHLRNSQLRDL